MTKTDSAYIGQNTQSNNDGTQVTWPAADGSGTFPPLGYNASDFFLGNYGLDTVYVSTDGLTTLTFGASLVSGSFSGTGFDNTLAIPYSGPYLSIDPAAYNETDEAFRGLIKLGQAEPFRDDNTGRIPIKWFSGSHIVHGMHVAPAAIHYPQVNPAHHDRGHFLGGVFSLATIPTQGPIFLINLSLSSSQDTLYFATDNGDGDTPGSGLFRIVGPLPNGGRLFIGPVGQTGYASNFASGTPGNHLITFTRIFPSAPVATPSSGSLTAGTTYYIRYCFTKTFNGVTIETALSPLLTVTGSTGYVFSVSKLPNGWTGCRLYVGTSQDLEQVTGGTYSSGANTVTLTSYPGTGLLPSYGFFAWAPGTDITSLTNLMKVGHLSGQPEVGTTYYNFHSFFPGSSQSAAVHHAPQSVTGGQPIAGIGMPDHFTGGALHPSSHANSWTTKGGATPYAAHKVLAADGSGGVLFEDVVGGALPTPGAGVGSALVADNAQVVQWESTGSTSVLCFDASIDTVPLFRLLGAKFLVAPTVSNFSLTASSGRDSGGSTVNVSAWTVNTWYYLSIDTASAIASFHQPLASLDSDNAGSTGAGDVGPFNWHRGTSGIYTDSYAHPPSGTPPQGMLIADKSDLVELQLTQVWGDGTNLHIRGWGRRTATGTTVLNIALHLQGAIS